MLALFGVAVVALALSFWRLGSTPAARAMFIPLLVVGALALLVGLTMSFNNQVRINTYSAAFSENPDEFVQAERERTEAFIKWYPYTMYSFSVVVILGLGVFLWKPTPFGRAIGLATLLLGLCVLFLDHFSEERAERYHAQIIDELER